MNAIARAAHIPIVDDHRDALARDARLRAVAGRPARAAPAPRSGAGDRTADGERRGRRRSSCASAARRAIGGATIWSGVDLDDRAGRVRRGARAERRRASRRCCGCCSGSLPLSRATRPVLGARAGPAQRRDRLPAPAPRLRRLDADPRHRPRPARARRRPLGAAARRAARGARSASTRSIELVGAERVRAAADRRVLGRRAAAAADRAGARRPARSCCSSTSRSTASTCRTRPPSRRCSPGSAAPRTSPSCSSRTTSTRCFATSTGSSTSPAGAIVSGRPERGDHERDAERALRRPDRGAARLRRAARRGRPARGAGAPQRPPRPSVNPQLSLDPVSDVHQLLAYPFMVNALEAGHDRRGHGRGRRLVHGAPPPELRRPHARGDVVSRRERRRARRAAARGRVLRRLRRGRARDRRRARAARRRRDRAQESAVIGTVQVARLRARVPLPEPLRRRARETSSRSSSARFSASRAVRCGRCSRVAAGDARRSSRSPGGRCSTPRSTRPSRGRAACRCGCSTSRSCSCSGSRSPRRRRSPASCSSSRSSSRRPPRRSS